MPFSRVLDDLENWKDIPSGAMLNLIKKTANVKERNDGRLLT